MVSALAGGVAERCAASWGIGLTGVAGPDPVDGNGPGRMYLGITGADGTDVVELDLPGARAAVRTGAVAAARHELLVRSGEGKAPIAAGVTPSADARRSVGPKRRAPRTVSTRRPPAAPPLPSSQDRRRP